MNTTQTSSTTHASRARQHNRRAGFIRWIRKTHGWIGLWGALLGLLFGTSGIWLNHRAVLKLPAAAQQRTTMQIAVPDPTPPNAKEMGLWLQGALNLDSPPSIRVEPARRVAWAEPATAGSAQPSMHMQPEHWSFRFGGPHSLTLVDAWAGNRSVSVRRTDNSFLGTLMNLHKGVGMSIPWILLVDTLAGSLIFLSISGVILWVQTSRKRAIGTLIFALSAATVAGLISVRL
ncbi:PepSY-associated TM helix domain-containing protein [Paralcaligenes ginsengisoli]